MTEQANGHPLPYTPEEIQQFLKQVPEELLANTLAEKIRQEPSREVINVVKAVSEQFSGPLPPPHILGEYDKVQTGLAARIVEMAEKEQIHRHQIEFQALSASISTEKRGNITHCLFHWLFWPAVCFLFTQAKKYPAPYWLEQALPDSLISSSPGVKATNRLTNKADTTSIPC